MLIEVTRTDDIHYRVRQFNSGNGIDNHKEWEKGAAESRERFLSFMDMSGLNEGQIRNSNYYYVNGDSRTSLLEQLYINKDLVQNDDDIDPLLFERPQLAGTCTASSKMVYYRSFGLPGRLLEIDLKVVLIKQLLQRIEDVQKGILSRPALLKLRKERSLICKLLTRNQSIKPCKGKEEVDVQKLCRELLKLQARRMLNSWTRFCRSMRIVTTGSKDYVKKFYR